MIILAIDPSIVATGWAILLEPRPNLNVLASGVWRPKHKDPYERLRDLCVCMKSNAQAAGVTDVVIETTSGKVGERHRGGGAGLSLYGVAVGGLYMAARWTLGDMDTPHHVHAGRMPLDLLNPKRDSPLCQWNAFVEAGSSRPLAE